MAKFKVGDTVKLIKEYSEGTGHNIEVGDVCVVSKIHTSFTGNYFNVGSGATNWNHDEKSWELVKGAKKVKEEKRNYIVVKKDSNSIECISLLTKKEAIEACESIFYIIDISNAPRYNKVTTFRMVPQKVVKVVKKIKKKTKKKKKGAK